ncbi:MAG: Stp1/IreP family PP2C-type Ser/Thr phosphatase, partial [Paludibacteraceae bacterium]|nr:Stp1/IreP family PP2C-type Ser/Thr phosphatase [Paludibacteraceae bacterium]
MSLTIVNSDNVFQKDVIGNVRTAQEDSHDIAILTPNGDVFVVCDGMGGHVGGKQASSIAVKSIIEHLKNEKYDQPMQALNDALQFANMQILGYAKDHPELRGMGTTACIVLLQDTEAYIAHVGDSRIYLYMGKEQQLHRVTKDHSYVQTLVDAGQITDEEAEHHPNKNRILKALGIKPELVPTCNVLHPKNGDCFLICSDGLNGMITDSTIEGVLKQNIPLADKGERLIQLALEAGGHDNIT